MKSEQTSTYILVSLLAFAAVGLLTGLYSGMIRLGFLADISKQPVSPMAHGPLMINGFLGTLIGLERAAALEKKWAYAAPVLLAVSTILILSGLQLPGRWMLLLGSMGLMFVMSFLFYLQPKIYHLIMALGAGSLLIGNLFYVYNYPIYILVVWWAAFPMLTIFGERLELNRIMRPPKQAQQLFAVLIILWIVALGVTYIDRTMGWMLASFLLIGIAGWLFKYDVARRTIKSVEWTRYSAISLLAGYGWLVSVGLFSFWQGFPTAGPVYDALLHMIFVGFVFSMIFAHASVIIPSLSGKLIPYSRYFYLPLILLHGFLVLRIIGDFSDSIVIRQIGSYGNVIAILLFLGGVLFQLSYKAFKKKSYTI